MDGMSQIATQLRTATRLSEKEVLPVLDGSRATAKLMTNEMGKRHLAIFP